ncbi:MAG: hypothetical protein VW268_00670 [Rhodospirillaceae bacterium]
MTGTNEEPGGLPGGSGRLTPEARKAREKLEKLDCVLPRSIVEWVAERERAGLDVPDILKRRLA